MTNTDILSTAFLVFLTANGYFQGFWSSLAKPVILLLTMAASSFYYFATHNLFVTLLICIPAQILFSWLINLGIKAWASPAKGQPLSGLNRFGGLLVSLLWGSAIILVTIAILALLPLDKFELANARKDIHNSKTLSLIKPLLIKNGLLIEKKNPSACLGDLCKIEENDITTLSADNGIQEIMNDPRIKKLMNDPAAMAAIEKRDLNAILANPVIIELAADPAFLMKAMQASAKIQQITGEHETTPQKH